CAREGAPTVLQNLDWLGVGGYFEFW
nr:immunoglobulin heavy chain junction region [Macaca mulatta]